MDGSLLDAAVGAGADGLVVAATGAGNTDPALLAAAVRAMAAGIPVALATRCPAGRAGTGYAFPGGGARWVEAGAHPGRPAVRGQGARRARARASAPGLDRDGLDGSARRPGGTRLTDAPRDAHHRPDRDARRRRPGSAGSRRSASATGGSRSPGSEVDLETRADPFTERIVLEPDEVAIPGLTDAHLHLAGAADRPPRHRPERRGDARRGRSSVSAPPTGRHRTRTRGWAVTAGSSDRWGRWPTADDLETVAPGRRVVLLGARPSRAARVARGAAHGRCRPGHAGPRRRRHRPRRGGAPDGVLYEAAARLVTVHIPLMAPEDLERGDPGGRA